MFIGGLSDPLVFECASRQCHAAVRCIEFSGVMPFPLAKGARGRGRWLLASAIDAIRAEPFLN